MTNADIIFHAGQQLAKEGKIGYTGKVFEAVDAAGTKIQVKETEAIHTFATWKQMGFMVQKGQKAIARITIWKYAGKVNEETGEDEGRMFLKTAAFFSRSQVEALA